MKNRKCLIPVAILLLFKLVCSCDNIKIKEQLFQPINPDSSGIRFTNHILENDSINYFTYPYLYMGGGVGIGDLNNDGLSDIFFTSNMGSNKLYLNEGNLKFSDITEKSGVSSQDKWHTGVTMIDINNDGWLDIYVCVSGLNTDRSNLLYVNNGDLSFTERASQYGIADKGHSVQSTFLDYDRDGDLDLYVANYPPTPFASKTDFYVKKMIELEEDLSDKLYENLGNGKFKDVTVKTGILNHGLSLSATAGDFNNDGWIDIYVSNDFSSPDYFYINNKDKTFKEVSKEVTRHTAQFGMGVDVADFNNDGLLDFMQVDMTPEDNRRAKANMSSMDPFLFNYRVKKGLHYQYMQNCLQLNQGVDGNGNLSFGDVSRLGGVSTTDWSWSVLMQDLDNDGWKDIFITNGTRRDVNNRDFFNDMNAHNYFKSEAVVVKSDEIPSEKVKNYAYRNNADLTFSNVSKEWGLDFNGFSNGASYADLDNDGDLEIIINNIDSVSLIFKNYTIENGGGNFVKFKLSGSDNNPLALGTKVRVKTKSSTQYQELTLSRGFQSSVEPILHFGLGTDTSVDSVSITWPDGKHQILTNLNINQQYVVDYSNVAKEKEIKSQIEKKLFSAENKNFGIDFIHKENNYNDYRVQSLLPYKYSMLGPGLAVGDVNGDGLDDFYIGGAHGFEGSLYLQMEDGDFAPQSGRLWSDESRYEDVAAHFFDADGDEDLDLYVVSGGNEFSRDAPELQDRLYLNDGSGSFYKSNGLLPNIKTSGSCVISADFDNDNDLDLFVGGRLVPGRYPESPRSYVLENKDGKFVDVTGTIAPSLLSPGMVTAAIWTDFNKDKQLDLVVVGEWMPITFYQNINGEFVDVTKKMGMDETTGWWYSIAQHDFDKDGDNDYVVGNLGLNYKYQASNENPFEIHADDFDSNGTMDIVLSYYNFGDLYPVRGYSCSSNQIYGLKDKFKTYNSFAIATTNDVYGHEKLKSAAIHHQAKTFASCYIENLGKNMFQISDLPNQAQISSINGIIPFDFNRDGHIDIVTAGNLYASEVETPRNDAGCGVLLLGDGIGNFSSVPPSQSGLYLKGDIKNIKLVKTKETPLIIQAGNQEKIKITKVNY